MLCVCVISTAICYFGNQEKRPFRSSFDCFSFYKRGQWATTLSALFPAPSHPQHTLDSPPSPHAPRLSPFTWRRGTATFLTASSASVGCQAPCPQQGRPQSLSSPHGSPPSTSRHCLGTWAFSACCSSSLMDFGDTCPKHQSVKHPERRLICVNELRKWPCTHTHPHLTSR